MTVGVVVGDRLADMPAGLALSTVLESVAFDALVNGSTVEGLRAASRQAARSVAIALAATVAVLECDPTAGTDTVAGLAVPDRYASDEVRAALALTRQRAKARCDFAYAIVRILPRVHAQMLAGRIDEDRAWVFADELADLPAALADRVLDAILTQAPELTTGQLGARIRKLIMTLEPDRAHDRYEKALAGRAVVAIART